MVMLGLRDQPGLFTAASRFAVDLDRLGFYGVLARDGRSIMRDEDFADCYSKQGRPSNSPALMGLAYLLKIHARVSDDETIARCKYDLRWKAALDLDPLSLVAPFSKTSFVGWRTRLLLHEKEGLALEQAITRARKKGLLPKALCVALDSTPLRGRGALKDTYNLLSDAVRGVVRAVAAEQGEKPETTAAEIGVERHFQPQSIKGFDVVDWDDEDAVRGFLGRLLDDCERVVKAARRAGCGGEAAALLERIVSQDIDQTENQPKIREGVAKGRVISVSDPEMRHGRKSSGKTFNGHKGHVAVDTDTGLITAVDVSAPGESDGSKVKALIEETVRATGSTVESALGDCAYSSRPAQAQAEDLGVDLLAKTPSPPKGRFSQSDFKISKDRETAECPAGHASVNVYNNKNARVHYWSEEHCGQCPLRDQCVKSETRRRTMRVLPDFLERQRKARRAKSKKGRKQLKKRVVVEHAIGRLKQLGAGMSRYFGRAKTKLQLAWTAAVVNLRLLAVLQQRAALKAAA